VKVGDKVLTGQVIAKTPGKYPSYTHASISGVVLAIEKIWNIVAQSCLQILDMNTVHRTHWNTQITPCTLIFNNRCHYLRRTNKSIHWAGLNTQSANVPDLKEISRG
jgi:hypothetical protein